MRRLRPVLVILSLTLGSLFGGAGCGGSDVPPPEDPTSVDPPRADAPLPSEPAPKTSGDPSDPSGAAGSGAPPEGQPQQQQKSPATPPPPEPAKTAEPAAPPPSPAASEVEGTIASRKGAVLVINTAAIGSAPEAGSKWSLFRFFEQKVGPFNTSGWLGIADVTVKGVKAGRLELSIDAEKSVIMVDGKKVDHFASGIRVKLEPPK